MGGERVLIEVLHSDPHLCVINKASGYVVHKTRGSGDSPVILQALRDQLGRYVYPVHRLDRGTSGCMIFAMNSEIVSKLQVALREGRKKYQALCLGHPPASGELSRPLTGENKTKQSARTKYVVLEKFEHYSLLELEILTGRKHQIRRHLSHEGNHIIGDVNHGKGWLNRRFREDYGFHRLFLHSHFLSFLHPIEGTAMNFQLGLSEDLLKLLMKLRS